MENIESGYQSKPASEPVLPPIPAQPDIQRVEELVGVMLDSSLDEAEARELEQLLDRDAAARSCFIEYVQLHGELLEYFSPQDD